MNSSLTTGAVAEVRLYQVWSNGRIYGHILATTPEAVADYINHHCERERWYGTGDAEEQAKLRAELVIDNGVQGRQGSKWYDLGLISEAEIAALVKFHILSDGVVVTEDDFKLKGTPTYYVLETVLDAWEEDWLIVVVYNELGDQVGYLNGGRFTINEREHFAFGYFRDPKAKALARRRVRRLANANKLLPLPKKFRDV